MPLSLPVSAPRRAITALTLFFAILLTGCPPQFDEDACLVDEDCFAGEVCSDDGGCEPAPTPAPVPPKINSFSADQSEVLAGATVTLSWTTADVSEATILADGFDYDVPEGDLASGSTEVEIEETITFRLRAENDGEAVTEELTVSVIEIDPPAIDAFEISPETIKEGERATLTWETTGADAGTITGGGEEITLGAEDLASGSLEVTPTQPTTYTLEIENMAGRDSSSVSVAIEGEPPVINDFSASSEVVFKGEDVTLSWDVSGAEEIKIVDNLGQTLDISGEDLTMGSREVSVAQSITYTMTASNPNGSVIRTISITARDVFEVDYFEASPAAVAEGAEATLSWQLIGPVDALTITDDQGNALDLTGVSLGAGSVRVNPTQDVTYTLDATSSDGQSVQAMTSITILPPPPTIVDFTASELNVVVGATVTLSWETVDADSITLEDNRGNRIDVSAAMVDQDAVEVVVSEDTTYTLTATNAGGAVFGTVAIVTGDPVTATISTNKANITYGELVTLSWTTSNATDFTITSSDGAPVDLSGKALAGDSLELYPANAMTTYTIVANGFAGPATATVTVNVAPGLEISDFSATPNPVTLGDSVTLSWIANAAQSVTLEAQDSSGTRTLMTGGQLNNGVVTDAPTEDTTYTLTVSDGATMLSQLLTVTVTTNQPLSIDSFTASTTTPMSGDAVTLSWQTTGATSIVLLDLNQGISVPFTDLGNGAGEVTVNPTADVTYQLIALGAQMTQAIDSIMIDVQ